MTDDTMYEITSKIYENLGEGKEVIATEIVENITKLEREIEDKYVTTINEYKNEICEVNERLNGKILVLAKEREMREKVSEQLKNLLIVRGYINGRFNNFWTKYKDKIEDKVTT